MCDDHPHKDGSGVIENAHERTAELARVRTAEARVPPDFTG